jgi:hypothetical protein
MFFLPMPHEVQEKPGEFQIRWNTSVILSDRTAPGALLWARMLRQEVLDASGLDLHILRGEDLPGSLYLDEDPALPPERYELTVSENGVRVAGGSDEALLHGVCTLRQWIRRNGAVLPCIGIKDWPDLLHRGFYQDISRGRVLKLDALKRLVDLLCEYKINEFQLYIEHTYLFRNLSEAWRDEDPLEAEDILELDDYCRERHIELIPSLATFGHMYQILSTKTCADLCELRDSEKIPFSYTYAIRRHTINPTHPGALELVKGMITEYKALFTSRKFNICCDETFDLCSDRSSETAAKEGAHNLYIRYLAELCRWLLEQGITPLFWGDVLGTVPESIRMLPKEGICLNWGYEPDYPEDEIRNTAKLGATQYACPGLNTWSHMIPLLEDSFSNIRAMCRYAHKYGAIGLLNTDWGDWGHICDPAFSIPGILYGAAFSWNAAEVSMEEMNDAISFLYYGDRTGAFMRAFTGLTKKEAFPWYRMIRWIEADEATRPAVLEEAMNGILQAPDLNAGLEAAVREMSAAVTAVAENRRAPVHALLTAAEGVRILNEIGLALASIKAGAETNHEDPAALAAALEKWYHEYIRVWERTCRRSTLERTRRLMDALADVLRNR